MVGDFVIFFLVIGAIIWLFVTVRKQNTVAGSSHYDWFPIKHALRDCYLWAIGL